jgi:hypothetical protein
MLEPQRLLTKLNAITVDWENYIRVTGPVLGAEGIAMGLAGLERLPYLLVRYLWSLDESVIGELYALLLSDILQLADRGNWHCKNDFQKLIRLIKMALHEMQHVNICNPCKGTGVVKHQTCLKCHGAGIKKRSQAEYAQYCGVSDSNWKRSWACKYQEVFLQILEWNEKAIKHLLSRI